MKKLLIILLVSLLSLTLISCGKGSEKSQTEAESTKINLEEVADVPEIIDLEGGWQQSNSNSETSYQIASIGNETIEIYWVSEDNTQSLYWVGTYIPPTDETNEYSWESVNDRSRTDMAILASTDDTKTFTHKDNIISYSVSALGTTTTVELVRSDDVNIDIQKAVITSELLPLEIVETGYFYKSGGYLQYAFIVNNPNTEKAVEFPTVRITARDETGAVLATDDIIGSEIAPTGYYSASLGPSIEKEPTTVDFEVLKPNDYNWITPKEMKPLEILSSRKSSDKLTGEILNPNDFDISSVAVVVLFRDAEGKLIAGDTTYTNMVSANGTLPFELSFFGSDEGYITDNFEVHAYPWL